MTRFYFDIQDNDGIHSDDFGDEMASVEAAEQQALDLLLDTASDGSVPQEGLTRVCRVRDEDGTVVYEATMVVQGKGFLRQTTQAAYDVADLAAGRSSSDRSGRERNK